MTTATTIETVAGSFRDPDGFLFRADGILYRQVNHSYQKDYDRLMSSGLYQTLADAGLLVSHEEANVPSLSPETCYKIIKPQTIPFISYPYEWCFSQLQDAALLTLKLQIKALEHGMTLKDASAYNVQFLDGKPVFIDTLSFETYEEGRPWIAYKQFCQHFLAPLALMGLKDIRLSQLFRVYIDGVPLDLASSLLPWNTRLSLSLGSHIHLHAQKQHAHADKADSSVKEQRVSKLGLMGLLDNLQSTVKKMEWKPAGTEWGDYYSATNYSDDAFQKKKALVKEFIEAAHAKSVWDLGANTGEFSRIASEMGLQTMAFDIDPAAVEKNYRQIKKASEKNLLPLVQDLTNPSPDLGWASDERNGFMNRGPVDCVMALALIHHLAISNNVPLEKLSEFFARLCHHLVIEFVPKSDSQVKRLLATREDIFPNYTPEGFESAFSRHFDIVKSSPVEGSERTLYLLKNKK